MRDPSELIGKLEYKRNPIVVIVAVTIVTLLAIAITTIAISFRDGTAAAGIEELRYEKELLRICWGAAYAPPYQGVRFTDNEGREGCFVTERGRPVLVILKTKGDQP